jgi:molybdate transport system substrate-binding protein
MKRIPVLILALCLLLALAACGATAPAATATPAPTAEPTVAPTAAAEAPVELLVYAGAGLKTAMEDIKTAYEAEHSNVTIEYVYAGSTQLISRSSSPVRATSSSSAPRAPIPLRRTRAMRATTYYQIAHHTPCIAVQAGNPKGITCLQDLEKAGVTVILGDPQANAIGQTAAKLIEKDKLDGLNANVVSFAATVNEIVSQIASGQADAGIVTVDCIANNSDVEIIQIPDDQNIDQIIPVCTLTMSENPDAAQAFVDFIASDAGKQIFADNGFTPVE